MKKYRLLIISFAFFSFIFSGCLTVEKKQYIYEITGKNSGKLTIKYINIMGSENDSTASTEEDFNDLIDNYLNGNVIDQSYPAATNIQKRLFEENGQLCGEVTLYFNNLNDVYLFKLDKKSPIMFSVVQSIDGEEYIDSNGVFGGENMKVVFWPSKTKKLIINTKVSSPDSYVSLLDNYKEWKK